MRKRFHQMLLALPVPALLIGADLWLRGDTIVKLPMDFKAYYAASMVFALYAWYAFLGFAKAAWTRHPAYGVALIVTGAAAWLGLAAAALGFYDYFHALPNLFTFEYILDEPRDCWIYAKSMLTPVNVVAFLAAILPVATYLSFAATRDSVAAGRKTLWGTGFALLLVTLFLHNNVRMGPNAFTPEIHALFSATKAVEFKLTGTTKVQVVGSGMRAPLKAKLGDLPHNVLLILNESIRAKSQSAFGYAKDTTPNLRQFFAQHKGNVVRFDHSYANATRTMLAFPSFFTGVVPSQAGHLMHKVPLVYDYARAFTNEQTFLITTQSMHWGNFDKFVGVEQLDYAWYKENSPYDQVDADRFESVDDAHVPGALEEFLLKRDKGKKFFGVIQLTGTHAPYRYDAESDVFRDGRLTNAYDNSLHYHDRHVGRILKLLEQKGLLEDTLIVSTSDHGEAFGEHGYSGHLNTFYDEEAKVPLWMHVPDRMRARQAAAVATLRANAKAQPVSNADIIPTVLSLLTGPQFPKVKGTLADLPGAPLDRTLAASHAVLMQNYNDIDEKTMFVGMGLVVGKYKYLLKFNQARGEEELYDLAADPKETVNVWDKVPDDVKRTIYAAIRRHKNSAELFRKAFPEKTAEDTELTSDKPEAKTPVTPGA